MYFQFLFNFNFINAIHSAPVAHLLNPQPCQKQKTHSLIAPETQNRHARAQRASPLNRAARQILVLARIELVLCLENPALPPHSKINARCVVLDCTYSPVFQCLTLKTHIFYTAWGLEDSTYCIFGSILDEYVV
jgi:hypothetical protein